MNHQLIPRVGQRCPLRQQRSLPKILHHHYVLESFFKSWNVPLENVVGVCAWRGGGAFWRPLVGKCGMGHGFKVFLVFRFSFFAGRPRWPVDPEGNATHPDLPVRHDHLRSRKTCAHAVFATGRASHWRYSSSVRKHRGWHVAQCWRKTGIPRIISRSSKWNRPPPQCRWTINSLYPAFRM